MTSVAAKTHLAIKHKILFYEQHFDVDQWLVNDVHIWPYIRIKLYFLLLTNLIDVDETKCKKEDMVVKRESFSVLKKVQLVFSLIISFFKNEYFFFRLKSKKIIFFGSHIHRVKHKEYYFNRFFDSMVDSHNIQDEVYMVEHQKVYDKNFNQKAIISLAEKLRDFILIQKIKNRFISKVNNTLILEDYKIFLEQLNKDIPNANTLNISEDHLTIWAKKINSLAIFYNKMFAKIKPEKIIFPGYYGWDNLYAAVYTANKLKIKTIDFQHGTQSDVHMAFSAWTKIPAKGFNLMPKEYWSWDEKSKVCIDHWAKTTSNIVTKVVGQSYLEYWKLRNTNLDSNKKTVLYSLQLMPLTIMFTEAIAFVIQDSRLLWEIRLHPRNEFSIEEIEKHLESFGVDKSKYNIHNAREIPLPEIMSKTAIHVTAFSGSLIEAKMMGVPSIIISSIGKEIYEDYIDDKLVFYLNQNEITFKSDFLSLCDSLKDIKFTSKELTVVNPIFA